MRSLSHRVNWRFDLAMNKFLLFCCLDAPLRFDMRRPTDKVYRHSTPSPIGFLKRERYRRKMIEKLVSIFDEDRSF